MSQIKISNLNTANNASADSFLTELQPTDTAAIFGGSKGKYGNGKDKDDDNYGGGKGHGGGYGHGGGKGHGGGYGHGGYCD